jgi:hypothetical protein
LTNKKLLDYFIGKELAKIADSLGVETPLVEL